MANRLWVVEMLAPEDPNWRPTVGVRLSREEGRRELADWKKIHTDDKFRLRPYTAVNPKRTPE